MANWKQLIGNIAPMIGGAIGGDLGEMAVTMAAKALGLPVGATESDVEAAVQKMTPEQRIALHAADNDFVVRKAEIFAQMKRDEHADRADARKMEVKEYSWIVPALALIAPLGFLSALFSLIFFGQHVSEATHDVLLTMLGALVTLTIGVYAYYFGSSSGSKAKTDLLGR